MSLMFATGKLLAKVGGTALAEGLAKVAVDKVREKFMGHEVVQKSIIHIWSNSKFKTDYDPEVNGYYTIITVDASLSDDEINELVKEYLGLYSEQGKVDQFTWHHIGDSLGDLQDSITGAKQDFKS